MAASVRTTPIDFTPVAARGRAAVEEPLVKAVPGRPPSMALERFNINALGSPSLRWETPTPLLTHLAPELASCAVRGRVGELTRNAE